MKGYIFLITYIFLHSHYISFSQEKPFIRFNEEAGMANNVVYDVARDNSGNLWIATGNGLSKYDGTSFTNFRKTEGLPGNMVWAVEPDENNFLYAACYLHGLAVVHHDKIIQTLHLNHPGKNDTFRKLYYSKTHKTLFIGTDFGIYILKDTTFHQLGHFNETMKKSSVLAIDEYRGTIYFTVHNDKEIGGFFKLDIHPDDILKSKPVQLLGTGQGYGLTVSGDHVYAALDNVIYKYNPETGQTGTVIKTDKQFYSWAMSRKGDSDISIGGFGEGQFKTGLMELDLHSKELKASQFDIGSVSVINLVFDPDLKCMWVCSDHGLFLLLESPFEVYPQKDQSIIKDILVLGNTTYILSDEYIQIQEEGKTENLISITDLEKIIKSKSGEYFKTKNVKSNQNNIDKLFYQLSLSKSLVPLNFTSDKGCHYLLTSSGAISFPDFSTYLPIPHGHFTTCGDRDTTLWIPKYDLLRCFPSIRDSLDNPYFNTKDSVRVKDIISIHSKDKVTYFASILNGLYAISGNRVHQLNSSNSEIDDSLTDMDIDQNGDIWCTSSDGNLFQIRFEDRLRIVNVYNKKNTEINGDNYKWLKFTSKYLYIGTDEGLNQIPLNQTTKDTIDTVYFYNRHNGYEFISAGSPQVSDDGSIFVHTGDKVIRVQPNEPFSTPKKIIFSEIRLNNEIIPYEQLEGKRLPGNLKSINILFSVAKLPGSQNMDYRFRINDNDWEVGKYIVLSNPGAGNYVLLFEARDKETSQRYQEVISFYIRPPIWQSTWFIVVFLLIATGLTYLMTKMRYNQKSKEREERILLSKKIADLQMQSLQSQINPHFVFNSLNSIQNFILNNNPEEASIYLATMGGIIRTNLEFISEESIFLNQEIQFLKKYIEIEKLRFKDKLDVEIINQVTDIDKTRIPPMLIQPLVENSIKHGIRVSKKKGIIKILFELNNGLLLVRVEDNGIGLTKSLQRKDQNHTSLGLKLIKERLALLNDKYQTHQFKIQITDLLEDEKPTGTRVEISIPQLEPVY